MEKKISWLNKLSEAKEKSLSEDKLIFLDFFNPH